MPKLNAFTQAYAETALWASTDDDGDSLDLYDISDIAPEVLAQMIEECADFLLYVHDHCNIPIPTDRMKRAGHDFWLTRNHHGAGFWDGDWGADGRALTEAAHSFGSRDLYVADDGLICQF